MLKEAMGAHREIDLLIHLKPLMHLSHGHIPVCRESQDHYSLLEGITGSSDSHMSSRARQILLCLKTPKEFGASTLSVESILQENYFTLALCQRILPRNSSMQRLGDCCEGAPTVWILRTAWTDVLSLAISTTEVACLKLT
jgi:hypothetical protein